MTPILVIINESQHTWFKEGDLIDFKSFEHLASTAAQFYQTDALPSLYTLQHATDDPVEGCVDITVFFSNNRSLDLHIHPYLGGGDFGVYDVIGDLMQSNNAPFETQTFLADVHRVLH